MKNDILKCENETKYYCMGKVDMIKILKDGRERANIFLGIIICGVITILFMFTYIFVNYHKKSIDITSIPVIEEDEKKFFHIESVTTDDNGVLYVTAAARNADINYDFFNWVLGKGNQEYKKVSILAVSKDEKTAYKLKTYPYAFKSQDSSLSDDICGNNGVLAYGSTAMLQGEKKKLAVLFEDREGKSYILYPKEDYYVDEK